MCIYEVNNNPTIEKLDKYSYDDRYYFRFQMKDWEMGDKSWGMGYTTEKEAMEAWEELELDPEEAVLEGKSCCSNAKRLASFSSYFDKDFRVIVLTGSYVQEGHDGEDVVDVWDIEEIWDYSEFMNIVNEWEG